MDHPRTGHWIDTRTWLGRIGPPHGFKPWKSGRPCKEGEQTARSLDFSRLKLTRLKSWDDPPSRGEINPQIEAWVKFTPGKSMKIRLYIDWGYNQQEPTLYVPFMCFNDGNVSSCRCCVAPFFQGIWNILRSSNSSAGISGKPAAGSVLMGEFGRL